MPNRPTATFAAALLAAYFAGATVTAATPPAVQADIDWASFLERHNLTWDKLPTLWKEAPFLGNGMMGTIVFQSGDKTLRWQVGRGDVRDYRPFSEGDHRVGTMYARHRLPIGHFELNTAGKITGGSIKLDLYNAEATGIVQTDKGTIKWRSFVPTDHMVIFTQIEPSEGERDCQWKWQAAEAISPRRVFRKEQTPDWYKPNPKPTESSQGDVKLCTQALHYGGETVTAWSEDRKADHRRLFISVGHSHPERTAAKQAISAIRKAQAIDTAELVEQHRAWWHAYYPKSFVSIPDAYWERFYWLQMYKLGSGTRADRMLLDLNGPWLQRTPWPGIWWNLNVQLTYWPTYASNRLDIGASLGNTIYANAKNLINNVPEAYRHDSAAIGRATGHDLAGNVSAPDGQNKTEPGLLLWALHNCYLHYRHSMDDQSLRKDLYPLLKRAVNFYFHFMTEDDAGVLHIPKTFSPEYKHGQGPNTSFELALLRWGCQALIDTAARLKIDDPLMPKWQKVLDQLAPYPTDKNGYMIAQGVPFNRRHRHYSHLLMLYPLYLVNADQPGTEALAMKSLKHWESFKAWHGYALTGASSMYSAYGHGNDALRSLDKLRRVVSYTTMYSEAGNFAQCIETPLSGAQSIHDMLLQSWGGTIRVFPAAPDKWADITFHDFRAEGAFLVSALREGGKTKWVRIKSLAGEPCRVRPNVTGEVRATGARAFKLTAQSDGVYTLDLNKGEEALIYAGDAPPRAAIAPGVPAGRTIDD